MSSFLRDEPLIILMVEDNVDHAELVIRNLREHLIANRVIHLLDGQIALDYLFRRGSYADPESAPRPNLVLLDLRLPRVDGLEVLKIIKDSEELRSIPVVILTTSEAERDVAMAYHYHANSYLVKPIDYADFMEMLRAFGFYWLGWNTQPS